MIGDWYKWYAEGQYYNYQVVKETFQESDETIANFEPIPLTPAILEKNGFYFGYTSTEEDMAYSVGASLDPDSKGWVYDEGAGAIKVQFPSESDGGQIFLYGDFYLAMVFDKIHVHQLQHALHFCGIDKEINI